MAEFSIAELFDLSGQCAIVTGAAQGIGQAIAYRLAEAGAAVLLAGHNEKGLAESTATIAANGGKAAFIVADIDKIADVDTIVQTAVKHFGGIDILVNCAGGMHPFTPALEITEETWHKTLDRNLKGSFFLAQRAARQMIAAGKGGRIINIASIAALRPDPQLAVYSASKAAVVSLTKTLANEFGRHGILVNTIAPGPIMTPNTAASYQIPEIKQIVAQRIPLGHVGKPADIANAVLFVASRAASNMHGSLLVVDGGMLGT
jgi:NAD(P)-dependent dehydrogenase (short-subunit alcohol dehydrogenase family)